MALGLVRGCQITIWRYLEDEERALLERLFPGITFQETNTKKTDQEIANFAGKVGWIEVFEFICDRATLFEWIDTGKVFHAAAAGGQTETMKLLIEEKGLYVPSGAIVEVVNSGELTAVKYILNKAKVEGEEYKTALGNAAEKGRTDILELFEFKGGFYESVILGAARGGKVNVMEWLRVKIPNFGKGYPVWTILEASSIAVKNGHDDFRKWLKANTMIR